MHYFYENWLTAIFHFNVVTLVNKAIQNIDMSVARLISIQHNNNTCSFLYPLFASIKTCTNYTSMPICYLCNSCIVNIQICYQFLNSSGALTLIRQQNTQYTFLAKKLFLHCPLFFLFHSIEFITCCSQTK